MRVLHAIHDFLPRHRAGSEIYAFELARELSNSHDVFVLAAEYDPSTAHGTLRWRSYGGLAVIEIVNNWEFEGFAESYSSPRLNAQLCHVLDATQPEVLHVHNLLNLSFDLPRLARERGIATVATLHDYTLVCASGGQRVHTADAHVCHTIEADRCSRCFPDSPFHRQMTAGRLTRRPAGRLAVRAATLARRIAPSLVMSAAGAMGRGALEPGDFSRRLAYARHVFETIDWFVAPSESIAQEMIRLGLDAERIEISDYGFVAVQPGEAACRRAPRGPLRIGFVGTLVWHKGAHVLIEALRHLTGAFEVHVHGDTTVFPDYVGRLRRAAAGQPVVFHGGFTRDDAGAVYRSMDVLVVPSLWPENSPLVIHEAFQRRIPVVGARSGGIVGLIREDVDGLLYDPFDPHALAESLQRFVDDPDLAVRLSAAAPPVKSMAQDAAQWSARYAAVRSRPPLTVAR